MDFSDYVGDCFGYPSFIGSEQGGIFGKATGERKPESGL
jgi:hypothetical protein